MDGGVAQLLGDLGEIHLVCPDQLLGRVDLHQREILDDAKSALFPEDLLELGAADEVFPAHLLDGDMQAQMRLQIIHHPVEQLDVALLFRGLLGLGADG